MSVIEIAWYAIPTMVVKTSRFTGLPNRGNLHRRLAYSEITGNGLFLVNLLETTVRGNGELGLIGFCLFLSSFAKMGL